MVGAAVRAVGSVFKRDVVVAVEERGNNRGESAGGSLRYINFCPSAGPGMCRLSTYHRIGPRLK